MTIGQGDHTYTWIDAWGQFPDTVSARKGWCHPGMSVTREGNVLTTHPGEPAVLTFNASGRLIGAWATGLTEVHHILLVEENGTELLWLTDNGSKRLPELGYDYPADSPTRSGRVVKTTLTGQPILELKLPDLPEYHGNRCATTALAVNEERFGGNGDIWVADGYGQSYVHRYDRHGTYLGKIDGTEGGGRFSCPHGVFVDHRKAELELYVADRANNRVQVYNMEGQFKRLFGEDFLKLPSTIVAHGDQLIIGELKARLTVLDADDRLVTHLGANTSVSDAPAWPNQKDDLGRIGRPLRLEQGKFNSPHGLAVDSAGNLYVSEWLIGGRLTKLAKG